MREPRPVLPRVTALDDEARRTELILQAQVPVVAEAAPAAPAIEPAPLGDRVVVIRFDWVGTCGVQPVLYLDRRWLH